MLKRHLHGHSTRSRHGHSTSPHRHGHSTSPHRHGHSTSPHHLHELGELRHEQLGVHVVRHLTGISRLGRIHSRIVVRIVAASVLRVGAVHGRSIRGYRSIHLSRLQNTLLHCGGRLTLPINLETQNNRLCTYTLQPRRVRLTCGSRRVQIAVEVHLERTMTKYADSMSRMESPRSTFRRAISESFHFTAPLAQNSSAHAIAALSAFSQSNHGESDGQLRSV